MDSFLEASTNHLCPHFLSRIYIRPEPNPGRLVRMHRNGGGYLRIQEDTYDTSSPEGAYQLRRKSLSFNHGLPHEFLSAAAESGLADPHLVRDFLALEDLASELQANGQELHRDQIQAMVQNATQDMQSRRAKLSEESQWSDAKIEKLRKLAQQYAPRSKYFEVYLNGKRVAYWRVVTAAYGVIENTLTQKKLYGNFGVMHGHAQNDASHNMMIAAQMQTPSVWPRPPTPGWNMPEILHSPLSPNVVNPFAKPTLFQLRLAEQAIAQTVLAPNNPDYNIPPQNLLMENLFSDFIPASQKIDHNMFLPRPFLRYAKDPNYFAKFAGAGRIHEVGNLWIDLSVSPAQRRDINALLLTAIYEEVMDPHFSDEMNLYGQAIYAWSGPRDGPLLFGDYGLKPLKNFGNDGVVGTDGFASSFLGVSPLDFMNEIGKHRRTDSPLLTPDLLIRAHRYRSPEETAEYEAYIRAGTVPERYRR